MPSQPPHDVLARAQRVGAQHRERARGRPRRSAARWTQVRHQHRDRRARRPRAGCSEARPNGARGAPRRAPGGRERARATVVGGRPSSLVEPGAAFGGRRDVSALPAICATTKLSSWARKLGVSDGRARMLGRRRVSATCASSAPTATAQHASASCRPSRDACVPASSARAAVERRGGRVARRPRAEGTSTRGLDARRDHDPATAARRPAAGPPAPRAQPGGPEGRGEERRGAHRLDAASRPLDAPRAAGPAHDGSPLAAWRARGTPRSRPCARGRARGAGHSSDDREQRRRPRPCPTRRAARSGIETLAPTVEPAG